MTGSTRTTPRLLAVFALAVSCAGLVALYLSWKYRPVPLDTRLALLIVAAFVSEFFAFAFPTHTMSLGYPLAIGASVLGGPAAAGVVALASSVSIEDVKQRRPLSAILINTGQLLVSISVGAWLYVALGGRILLSANGEYVPLGADDFPTALIAMAAAGLLSYGMNVVLVSSAVSISRRASFRSAATSGLALLPTQFSLALVGLLMAQVLAIAAVTLPLFVFPQIVGRQFYQRYLGLRGAFRDTVKSLVGALEAKDPYTRGHSFRVADYAVQIGRAAGLTEESLYKLEHAALLHDLGKLSMPTAILAKPGALTSEEFEMMRSHPARGAEILAKLPPLRDLTETVRCHHERMDGRGYPNGLAALDIPRMSRILAVADSYDAMTTTRAYRAGLSEREAVAELGACSGTQFDPEFVSALLGILDAPNGGPATEMKPLPVSQQSAGGG